MMTADQPRPLQFNLRSIFGLTAAVGLLAWLASAGSREAPLFLPVYLFVGLAQIVLARVVWLRETGRDWKHDLHRQTRETAVVACGLTLAPWAVLVVGLALFRLRVLEAVADERFLVFVTGMLVAVMLHTLGCIANLINLVLAGGSLRDRLLVALMLLNLANTAVPILFFAWEIAH